MPHPFFTIGHSTRSVIEFVELLAPLEVRLVVDVRAIPRSRTNPRYDGDIFPETLSQLQIQYEHIAALALGKHQLGETALAVSGRNAHEF